MYCLQMKHVKLIYLKHIAKSCNILKVLETGFVFVLGLSSSRTEM